jgi:hypothetical protein
MKPEFQRFNMSREERELRSRLTELLHGAGILHGSLAERHQVCGNPTCHCVDGEKHRALVLAVRRDRKVEQIYVPAALEGMVRRWLDQARRAEHLLREISRVHVEKLREEKKRERLRRKKEG